MSSLLLAKSFHFPTDTPRLLIAGLQRLKCKENIYFRYLESIELTLCLTCKYSGISECSDQIVPILLQRKICIEFI